MTSDVAVPDLGAELLSRIASSAVAALTLWRELHALLARRNAVPDQPLDQQWAQHSEALVELSKRALGLADDALGRAKESAEQANIEGALAALTDHARHLGEARTYATFAHDASDQAAKNAVPSPALQTQEQAREAILSAQARGERALERALAAGLVTTTGVRPAQGRAAPAAAARPATSPAARPAVAARR